MLRTLRLARFESLEQRTMLTGNVKVYSFGSLLLIGDNAANKIVVRQVGARSADGTISVEIQGIGTNLLVAKPREGPPVTGLPKEFFPAQKSVIVTAYDLEFRLSGGNDSLTFTDTKVPGDYRIDMGSGRDHLLIHNVQNLFPGFSPSGGITVATHPSDTHISLGAGKDVAVLDNVRATVDVYIWAGDGNDFVSLHRVRGGTDKSVFDTSYFNVDMGAGNSDTLVLTACAGDQLNLYDSAGNNGHLFRFGNHFRTETVTGFASVDFPFVV